MKFKFKLEIVWIDTVTHLTVTIFRSTLGPQRERVEKLAPTGENFCCVAPDLW